MTSAKYTPEEIGPVQEMRANSEWAAARWAEFRAAVKRINTSRSLRELNDSLGYNMVKTIPGLLAWIEELQRREADLIVELAECKARTGAENLNGTADQFLGIPFEHIVVERGQAEDLPADFLPGVDKYIYPDSPGS